MDFDKMLGKLLNGGAGAGFGTGLAGGLAASMLTTRRGRRVGATAVKFGGIAALGALAWNALQKAQAGQAAAGGGAMPVGGQRPALGAAEPELVPPAAGSAYAPAVADVAGRQRLGRTLVQAMIAAAHADGGIDGEESKRILDAFQQVELTAEEKGALIGEMASPVSIEDLARAATGPEVAAEIYGASLLAIQVDHPAEKAYLERLATRLNLAPEVVAGIHAQLGVPIA